MEKDRKEPIIQITPEAEAAISGLIKVIQPKPRELQLPQTPKKAA